MLRRLRGDGSSAYLPTFSSTKPVCLARMISCISHSRHLSEMAIMAAFTDPRLSPGQGRTAKSAPTPKFLCGLGENGIEAPPIVAAVPSAPTVVHRMCLREYFFKVQVPSAPRQVITFMSVAGACQGASLIDEHMVVFFSPWTTEKIARLGRYCAQCDKIGQKQQMSHQGPSESFLILMVRLGAERRGIAQGNLGSSSH